MARNAYGMAIPEKNRRLFSRKIDETNEKVLELGREKRWRGGEYTVLQDFSNKSIGDKFRGQNLVKKLIFKESAGQKNPKFCHFF